MRSTFLNSAALGGLASLMAAAASAQIVEIPDSGPGPRGRIERGERVRELSQDNDLDRPSRRDRDMEQRRGARPSNAQMEDERGQRRRGNDANEPDQRRQPSRAQQTEPRATPDRRAAPPAQAEQQRGASPAQAQDQRAPTPQRDTRTGQPAQPSAPAADPQSAESGRRSGETQAQINVSPDRAARIHETLIRSGARTNVRVDVNIGRPIAPTVRLRPVPTVIVDVSPELRGYEYAVVDEEIVIVEPRTRRVVEVIGAGGRMASAGRAAPSSGGASGQSATPMTTGSISAGANAALTLSSTDRERVRRAILSANNGPRLDLLTGAQLPTTIQISAVPDDIVAIAPTLKGYHYFVTGERVIFVDPAARAIVDIVQ